MITAGIEDEFGFAPKQTPYETTANMKYIKSILDDDESASGKLRLKVRHTIGLGNGHLNYPLVN